MQTSPDGESWSQWRDTIIIPAYGKVKIWIRFPKRPGFNLDGKTVFHVSWRQRSSSAADDGCQLVLLGGNASAALPVVTLSLCRLLCSATSCLTRTPA